LAVDHAPYGVKPLAILSDPYLSGTESNKTLIKDEYNSTAPYCTSSDSMGWAPNSKDNRDDILFSQYFRSPSPSPAPSPDDTSSGTTLVDIPSRQICGSPELSSATAASVIYKESATQEEEPCYVNIVPWIWL
jgi:hypothetical protein